MDKQQRFWDKQAEKFDKSEKQFAPVYDGIIAKTKAYLNENNMVMDLGCATGTKTLNFAGSVKQIYGIDISPEMIRLAKEKQDGHGIKNADFARGTLFENEFKDIKFDAIIAYGILHLLENVEEVLSKVHDSLKPGGLFISTTACYKDKASLKNRLSLYLYFLMQKLGMFPLHLNNFTFADVEELMGKADLVTLEAERIFSGMTICFLVAKKH